METDSVCVKSKTRAAIDGRSITYIGWAPVQAKCAFYDLAMSYSGQLLSCLQSGEAKPYQAFKDTNRPLGL